MIPTKIKFTFTQTELLNLSVILRMVLTENMPEVVDKSARAMYLITQTSLKKLYTRIRIKIEDGPLTGNVKFSFKQAEFLAFYVIFISQETNPNQSLKMLN